jgi:hypothetical protein
MLRTALSRARVPASLYVLPGQPRPAPSRTSSYYLLAKNQTQFSAGIVEGRQGRIGAEFSTEDEACRWMYGELVVKETRPKRLTPPEEQQAPRLATSLVRDVKTKMAQGAGDSFAYPVPQGSLVDQFGQESGSALSPAGTPFAQRGLTPSAHDHPRLERRPDRLGGVARTSIQVRGECHRRNDVNGRRSWLRGAGSRSSVISGESTRCCPRRSRSGLSCPLAARAAPPPQFAQAPDSHRQASPPYPPPQQAAGFAVPNRVAEPLVPGVGATPGNSSGSRRTATR